MSEEEDLEAEFLKELAALGDDDAEYSADDALEALAARNAQRSPSPPSSDDESDAPAMQLLKQRLQRADALAANVESELLDAQREFAALPAPSSRPGTAAGPSGLPAELRAIQQQLDDGAGPSSSAAAALYQPAQEATVLSLDDAGSSPGEASASLGGRQHVDTAIDAPEAAPAPLEGTSSPPLTVAAMPPTSRPTTAAKPAAAAQAATEVSADDSPSAAASPSGRSASEAPLPVPAIATRLPAPAPPVRASMSALDAEIARARAELEAPPDILYGDLMEDLRKVKEDLLMTAPELAAHDAELAALLNEVPAAPEQQSSSNNAEGEGAGSSGSTTTGGIIVPPAMKPRAVDSERQRRLKALQDQVRSTYLPFLCIPSLSACDTSAKHAGSANGQVFLCCTARQHLTLTRSLCRGFPLHPQVVEATWHRIAASRILRHWHRYQASDARAARRAAATRIQAAARGAAARRAFRTLSRQRDVLRALEAAARAGQLAAVQQAAAQARELGAWQPSSPLRRWPLGRVACLHAAL